MSAWDPIDASAPQVCFVSFQYDEDYLICYMCLFFRPKILLSGRSIWMVSR